MHETDHIPTEEEFKALPTVPWGPLFEGYVMRQFEIKFTTDDSFRWDTNGLISYTIRNAQGARNATLDSCPLPAGSILRYLGVPWLPLYSTLEISFDQVGIETVDMCIIYWKAVKVDPQTLKEIQGVTE